MAHVYSRTCVFKSVEDIKGKHVTIMGLGLNGGGEAAVRFFLKKGAFVTVTDKKTQEQLKATIDSLENDATLDKSRLTYRIGEHKIEDFEKADCVIKNPGVNYEGNEYLAAAKAIETDLSIFLRFTNAPIIAVTGSKGKSSTVSSIYYGLKQAGYNCFMGGNITVSPLSFFDEVTPDSPVVLELSSWQLADLRGRGVLKPHISIITKIVPDHQNWYHSMEKYVADKRLIYADQSKGDYSIFDAEDDEPGTSPDSNEQGNAGLDCSTWGNLFASESKATVFRYGKSKLKDGCYGVWQEIDEKGNFCGKVLLPGMTEEKVILRELTVPGDHMRTNVLNAALVLYLMGVEPERIISILGNWQGIEHRLQYFHSWHSPKNVNKEYKFFNDTCATVPEAAAAATQAFGKPVILLTGGTDKGLVLNPLIQVLTNKKPEEIAVKSIYLLKGSATDRLLPYLDSSNTVYNGPYDSLDALLTALKQELEEKVDGNLSAGSEVVVFSPGATSFGMFNNEFDRGEQFMNKVKALF
ncbi:MAG: UDP-N-acetylmuramoyl-L-alanine--D-glutamate ligase [Treponema sp.]|nr:UDP-N-acetylmuramoyl-L-alanine--D-glutamate ligase [Treponema sp.]